MKSKCFPSNQGRWIPSYPSSRSLPLSDFTNASTVPSVEGFRPENKPGPVTNRRSDGTAASFCFDTADHPPSGKQCLLYVVRFPDAATWAVRVPAPASHLPPESITSSVEMEVSVPKRLATSGLSWSPRPLGYSSGFGNPLGFPGRVGSWIPGTPLQWSDAVPSPRESRSLVIRQVVDMMSELAGCTKEVGRDNASLRTGGN